MSNANGKPFNRWASAKHIETEKFDSKDCRGDWNALVGGKEGVDRPEANWSAVVGNEVLLIKSIRRFQNTLRLLKVIPIWYAFQQSEGWFKIKRKTEAKEQRKFEAYWNLVLEFWPERDADGKAMQFALCVVIQKKREKEYAKFEPVSPDKFGIDKENEIKIRDFVSSNYEALTAV